MSHCKWDAALGNETSNYIRQWALVISEKFVSTENLTSWKQFSCPLLNKLLWYWTGIQHWALTTLPTLPYTNFCLWVVTCMSSSRCGHPDICSGAYGSAWSVMWYMPHESKICIHANAFNYVVERQVYLTKSWRNQWSTRRAFFTDLLRVFFQPFMSWQQH